MFNPIKVVTDSFTNTTDKIVTAVKTSLEDMIANRIVKQVEEKVCQLEYPIVVNIDVIVEIKL